MRQSASQIIAELSNRAAGRCCPNCHAKGPFTVAFDRQKGDGEKLEQFDSFLCVCGQRWTEGFEITYFPRVEYRENVGDMAEIPKNNQLL